MDISFNDNDTPEEFETKMSLVESYSYRLKEKMKGRRYLYHVLSFLSFASASYLM